MKKLVILIVSLISTVALAGCTTNQYADNAEATADYTYDTEATTDYPAAIMVDDTIYLLSLETVPTEVAESAIIGYTTSYINTFPEKNGETNFNRELDMPYAQVENGLAVLHENEWYLCTPNV